MIKKLRHLPGITLLCVCLGTALTVTSQITTASGKSIPADRIDAFLQSQMDSLKLPGLAIAIINDKKIVYQRNLGYANLETKKRVDSETIFEAASMSKTVFGYFVLKLLQDGLLQMSLDTPLYKYMPYPDAAGDDRYKLITGRMVLTHTSGFPNWRTGDKLTIGFMPGTKYSYSGEGYEYLVNVIATLTHTNSPSLDSIVGATIARPLGLKHFAYTANDYLNTHKAYGYYSQPNQANGICKPVSKWFGASYTLHTNTTDFAHFLIGIMENKALTAANTDSLLLPRVTIIENDRPAMNFYGKERKYGFGVVIDQTPWGSRYQHTGNNGNFTGGYMFFKEKGLGFVVFTNGDNGVLLDIKLADLLTDGTVHYPVR